MAPQRFKDPRRIFIDRDYWRTSERRRPILLLAWYTQFVSVLMDQLDRDFPGVINDVRNLGAHDILKYVHVHCISLLPKLRRENQELAQKALERVKLDRNKGTHQKIQSSGLLRTMFGHMMEFCDLSGIQGLQTFKEQCEKGLDQLNSNNRHLY